MKKLADCAKRYLELWGYSIGSGQTETALAMDATGNVVEIGGIGTTAITQAIKSAGAFDPAYPVSFAQGRKGEVFIVQGRGKPVMVRDTNGNVRTAGLAAPALAPAVGVYNSPPNYYVSRVDIIDAGNGYHLPPTVQIAAPTTSTLVTTKTQLNSSLYRQTTSTVYTPIPGARAATAVARIAGAAVSEISVTDGGTGYITTPIVKLVDQPEQGITGTGAECSLALMSGCAGGDYKTGVVYWQPYRPTNAAMVCIARLPRWNRGVLVNADTGSGTGRGAVLYLELTQFGLWYFLSWQNAGINSCPAPLQEASDPSYDQIIQSVQVYNFGSGYTPGDQVIASVAASTRWPDGCDNANIFNTRACPLQFIGTVYGAPDCPDNLTCKEASPAVLRKVNPTIVNGGSGYLTPPTFITDDGEEITTEIDWNGRVTALHMEHPNNTYLWAPELVSSTGDVGTATAVAVMRGTFRGTYQCYYRYVNDSVPTSEGGPIFSSMSPVFEADCGDHASKLVWALEGARPSGATSVELWRSTSDQATTLFRVAKISVAATPAADCFGSLTDEMSDWDLTDPKRTGFLAMPILLSDGSLNANRFGVPPTDFAVGVVFQDRAFLGVDTSGAKPNTIMYSEVDEPESIPELNELVLQTNLRDTDYITAIIPYAGALVVGQSRHCHRLTYIQNPQTDASVTLLAYRGVLNQRCWDIYGGSCYMLDDLGLYSLDPQGNAEPLSVALDNMFRENTDPSIPTIDFSKRQWFFVRADRNQKVIRCHVAFKGDEGKYPTRQLVYSTELKTFWVEKYPTTFTAATELRSATGQIVMINGGEAGLYQLAVGLTDDGAPVDYSFKSGNLKYVTDAQRGGDAQQARTVSAVFQPTRLTSLLYLSAYYNGSKTPRGNAVRRDRGVGFVHSDTIPAAYVDLKQETEDEYGSHGIASALFAGKTINAFYGHDICVAVQLWGQQTDAGAVVIHTLDIEGVEENG